VRCWTAAALVGCFLVAARDRQIAALRGTRWGWVIGMADRDAKVAVVAGFGEGRRPDGGNNAECITASVSVSLEQHLFSLLFQSLSFPASGLLFCSLEDCRWLGAISGSLVDLSS